MAPSHVIYSLHYFALCTRAAVCNRSDLGCISPAYFGGQMAAKSPMRWWHTHIWMDDSLLLPPAASMSKGTNLEGAVIRVRNTTVAKLVGEGGPGGRRTRPDKNTLRTTTKASGGWQEGLKNRDSEAPGEDLFLWMDGDAASFRRGCRLGRRRAQIQPLWRARGLPAPKRDTLNHLLLVPDAGWLLEPGW